MRWVAHGMLLNEELYCAESLASVYDFVDEIVLIEGATQYTYFADYYGLSSDRTAEIIRDFPDPEGKIRFEQVGWVPTKNELRSISFDLLTKDRETCILVLDLDEVWDPDDLQRADEHFTKDPTLLYLHCDLIQLRKDVHHYRDMSTGDQEHDLYNEQADKQPITTRNDVDLREGRTAERLFRWEPGMTYEASHVTIMDSVGRFPYIDPAYHQRREADMSIKFWHYNYLKPWPEIIAKFCYFSQQDAGHKRNDPEMLKRALGEGYIEYLRTGKHPKGDWPVTLLPPGLRHPPAMHNHPVMDMDWKQIVDPTNEWLPTILGDPYDQEKVTAMLEEASRYMAPANINDCVIQRRK